MFYNVFCFFFVLVPTPVATAYNMFIENSDVCISKITRGIKEKRRFETTEHSKQSV